MNYAAADLMKLSLGVLDYQHLDVHECRVLGLSSPLTYPLSDFTVSFADGCSVCPFNDDSTARELNFSTEIRELSGLVVNAFAQ